MQGLAETIVGRGNAPTYCALQKRMTRLDCTLQKRTAATRPPHGSDGNTRTEISLCGMDSAGLKPTIRGDRMAAKWGVRRGFIKLHIGVNAKTEKNCAVLITDDRCGDSPQSD